MKFRFLAAACFALVLLVSFVPHAHASIWTGAYCGGSSPIGPNEGPTGPCGFCDALFVGKNIITFLTEVAVSLTVFIIVIGAIRLVIAGGDPGAISEARLTMWRGIQGLLIVVSSWTLMNALLIFIARGTAGGDISNWKWYEIQCNQ